VLRDAPESQDPSSKALLRFVSEVRIVVEGSVIEQPASIVGNADVDRALAEIHRDLRWKRLNRTWAKVEILLGLVAAACGITASRSGERVGAWLSEHGGAVLCLALVALGGYLMLAGHRSLLYQSQTQLTAYVLARIAKEHPH
jgi:hypothetical protein